MMSKEKLKDILLINKLNSNLMSDMKNMKEDSTRVIRDFKLNNLVIWKNYMAIAKRIRFTDI